ncbi:MULTISPECIES: DUF397 domain-containing protein [unclassified Streptomyces]|uniref:DUF397 domain-containing protein n=1 Tax=unclassified Streptomyces TaxID=2593676 RepID=UPI00081F6F0B|nr:MULTISPECIES: DUF397 domain-containing protein [unclassified Streptomyces]MYR26577.1 DUF397 domain-containing protein [Streptomyces sp. SID4945]SCD95918.1 protein of unknown function [Streptomyces sp. TverLS-915]SCF06630.1 protein of unknown function [Streptomyces sp. LcepLS]
MNKKVDLTNAAWAKSELSNGGDNCLEVAFVDGVVALRDSVDVGDPAAQVLVVSRKDYELFTASVRAGQADLLP